MAEKSIGGRFKLGGTISGPSKDYLLQVVVDNADVEINLRIHDKDDKLVMEYKNLETNAEHFVQDLSLSERIAAIKLLENVKGAIEKMPQIGKGVGSKIDDVIEKLQG